MDFIGRFETRSQDLDFISNKINFNISSKLHINPTQRARDYTQYYDEETKKMVAEKYAKEIKYFQYEFGE